MVEKKWPANTFGVLRTDDWGATYSERGEIYNLIRDEKITGFGIVSGDRHSFWAAMPRPSCRRTNMSRSGSALSADPWSARGRWKVLSTGSKKTGPCALYNVADRPDGTYAWTYNLLLKHGVRSALEYANVFDIAKAHAVSNPDLAPHLEFIDAGGHGYATVRLSKDEMRTEFVCIPRPVTRSQRADGGDLRYRIVPCCPLVESRRAAPGLSSRFLEGGSGIGNL
jgi:alkaline phosphatase D